MTGARGGFWQEYIAAVVLAVLLGASGAAGVAGVMDAVFVKVTADVLGPADEFTLIVHLRAEAVEGAARQIETLLDGLETELSGAAAGTFGLRQGVNVAGNANFFITVPERFVETDVLERLPGLMQQLPGFNGHTWLLEPSVTVAARDVAVRDALAAETAAMDGVRAVVRHGTRLTAVTRDEGARAAVARRLEERLAQAYVVDVERPGTDEPLPPPLRRALEAEIAGRGWRVLRDPADDMGGEPFADAVAALQKLPEAWARWSGAGADAEAALRQLIAAVDALEPLVAAAGGPDVQARRLSEALREGDGAGAVKDVLVRLAASALWQALAGEADGKAAAKDGAGVEAGDGTDLVQRWLHVRELLEQAAEGAARAAEASDTDLEATAAAMESLRRLLPRTGPSGTGVTIFADGTGTADEAAGVVESMVEHVLDGDGSALASLQVTAASPGVVEPNPRALLASLLHDVRGAVAGLLAFVAAFAALLLDHATVFAAWSRMPSRGFRRWSAAAVGAVLFVATYSLAGGAVPSAALGGEAGFRGMELLLVAMLGAGAGLLTARLAPRISPVDEEELLAGMSLGLDDDQILREIVVPRGRPGVLTFLNEFRRVFP